MNLVSSISSPNLNVNNLHSRQRSQDRSKDKEREKDNEIIRVKEKERVRTLASDYMNEQDLERDLERAVDRGNLNLSAIEDDSRSRQTSVDSLSHLDTDDLGTNPFLLTTVSSTVSSTVSPIPMSDSLSNNASITVSSSPIISSTQQLDPNNNLVFDPNPFDNSHQ